MSSVPKQYRDMLRNALKEEKVNGNNQTNNERPLKRAKRLQTPVQRARELRNNPPPSKETDEYNRYVIHLDGSEDGENNSYTTKNRNLKIRKDKVVSSTSSISNKNSNNREIKEPQESNESEDEDIDSEDFEDVDLNNFSIINSDQDNEENGDINITIKQHREDKTKLQRTSIVTKNERTFRRTIHLMHLFIMVGHGTSRNLWLSDPNLLLSIQEQIPDNLKLELNQYQDHRTKTNVTSQSKTRKLLDFLRHLMEYWQKLWTIDFKAPVLYKKTWSEIRYPEMNNLTRKQRITKKKFRNMVLTHNGSRDIAAQGFVALLRALNLPARLVFSIQPPDFTNMKICDKRSIIKESIEENQKRVKPTFLSSPNKISKGNSIDRILANIRSKKSYSNISITSTKREDEFLEKYGAWPVFWVEVWDKDAKKYITIDPIVKKIIEVISWKSKLEPPMNSIRNNSWYVVGYDRVGGVRDITRRYAKEFNAKIRKKRITREPKWNLWWNSLLSGACSEKRIKQNRVDKFEQIEFEELELKEGMPANIGDFKGHPVYVLEKDLKYNEILMPKISCGGISKKGKLVEKNADFIPVYKRSNVHIVRSAKGWFMRGRVLKLGERPLKIRSKKDDKKKDKRGIEDEFQLSDNDQDEDDARLYSESQTVLYVPPPIVNGIIPKNAFKNIDVYETWMIPEGCVHIKSKLSEKAAKIMGIEYAPAVVGFNFAGSRRDASAKIEGIVTFQEYKEAVELICKGLSDMEEEEIQMKDDLINLRAWRILLTKLKINKRLLHEHGEIKDGDSEISEIDGELDGELDSEETGSDVEEYKAGGFVLGSGDMPASNRTRSHFTTNEDYNQDDLSASDFESEIEDIDSGGFSIKQIDHIKKPKIKNKTNAKNNNEEIIQTGASKSIIGGETGVMIDDNDGLVYNPKDDGDNYIDSDDSFDANDSDNVNDDTLKVDDRMNQLDLEFAELVDDMGTSDHRNDLKKYNREDHASEMNSENGANDQYKIEDDNYEFGYSD